MAARAIVATIVARRLFSTVPLPKLPLSNKLILPYSKSPLSSLLSWSSQPPPPCRKSPVRASGSLRKISNYMSSSGSTSTSYKYTYKLGRSLYVPLTSRCNSIPLPQTRGPGFLLPKEVASALLRVREAENMAVTRGNSNLEEPPVIISDTSDGRISLPPYNLSLVCSLYSSVDGSAPQTCTQQNTRQSNSKANNSSVPFDEDCLQPPISELVGEVTSRLAPQLSNAATESKVTTAFDQVVIAGEGEPTLRMEALLAVAKTVKSLSKQFQVGTDATSKNIPKLRVITNGLCYGIPYFGYQPPMSPLPPPLRHHVLNDMREAGITSISVALNTANRLEYDVLMSPCCGHSGAFLGLESGSNKKKRSDDSKNISSTHKWQNKIAPLSPGHAHDLVCEFILEAVKIGMKVEITGIARPDIEKKDVNRLAAMLLSVGVNKSRREKERKVRWRDYFE